MTGVSPASRRDYDVAMYTDALSFLEDERDAWRPYEVLSMLSNEELERPVADAHGWSGRDLMGHLLTWQLLSLDVARDLAVGVTSRARTAAEADWADRGGDAVNAEAEAVWREKSIDEVRQEFARVAGELRGYLTVVPETRWLKNAEQQRFFYEETIEHYDDHKADLAAILTAAGRA
jgi:hypothetical protein